MFQEHIATMLSLKHDSALFCEHVSNLSEPLTALQFMIRLNEMSKFWNHEEKKPASNSVLRRWIEQGAILFNGERMLPNENVDFPLFSVIIFPKSESKRITLL